MTIIHSGIGGVVLILYSSLFFLPVTNGEKVISGWNLWASHGRKFF
jgi:hypothetical protein